MKNLQLATPNSFELATRFDPQVVTTATPTVASLLRARANIQANAGLATLFDQAQNETRSSEWLENRLSLELTSIWGMDSCFEAYEAAKYLSDEWHQLGEGMHIVSSETGKILVTLNENETYQPALVPRESGAMARPLPQIRPDIEAAILMQLHEKHREEGLVARVSETVLSRELAILTRQGRKNIASAALQEQPLDLLKAAGGTTAAFLSHFELCSEHPETALEKLEGVATARSSQGLQDPTTSNFKYDKTRILKSLLAQGWVREIARKLSYVAHEGPSMPKVSKDVLTVSDLGSAKFWIGPPEHLRILRSLKATVLPVEGAKLIGLTSKVGYLVIGGLSSAASREMFSRWEVLGSVPYTLYIDWNKVACLSLTDVTFQGEVC